MTEETIAARAHREGRWWVFTIPALTSAGPTGAEIVAMGQSRSLKDLDEDVRDVAALWLDLESWDGAVDVVIELPAEVSGLLSEAESAEREGRAAMARSARLRREAARSLLADHRLTQAEAARVLQITPQRMSQLVAPRKTSDESRR
ncbi:MULTISPECIES: hypothetical protein [unclassified Rathayibacter]|uniref:hypothetical protein n=1 Tax=unclassified Rathayibacter TaxID=2609250 RepID=UPI000F4D1912|nr:MULTISPECIES: hypothetical protein [unclassified Rathayibacter]ROP49733.1 hypothetical protein EDF45_2290 [Rathayibacter sp. PhB186]ROS51773.1 hypothetical protein EDF44_2109 [Rathayibacter sp. PhB185]